MEMNIETAHENKRAFKGVWIPAEVWLCPHLSATDKALYAEISSLDGDEGCFASNDYLAEFLGLTRRSVQLSIATLKDNGFIRTQSFNGRTRVLRISAQQNNTISHQTCKKFHVWGEKNFTSEVKKISPIYNSIEKSIDTPIVPQGDVLTLDGLTPPPQTDDKAQGFEDFWRAYPKCERKVAKSKCRDLWIKKNLASVAQPIMQVLAVDAASHDWKKENGQFIPMPQTWLNRKRWEDNEPSSPRSAAPSSQKLWAVYTAADADREPEFLRWAADRTNPPPAWAVRSDEWVQQNREDIIRGFPL